MTEEEDLIIDGEDCWTYSLPPSLESLPLKVGNYDDSNPEKEEDKESVISELEEETTPPIEESAISRKKKLKVKTNFYNGHSLEEKELPLLPIQIPRTNDSESTTGVLITTPPKQTIQPSFGSSYSTSSLTQLMKSSPLGPLTTVEEVHNNRSSSPSRNSYLEMSSLDEKSEDGSLTSHKKLTGTIYQLQKTMSVNSVQSKDNSFTNNTNDDNDDNEDNETKEESISNATDSTIDTTNLDASTIKLPSSESNGSFFSSFRNVAQSMLQSPSGSQVRVTSDSFANGSLTNSQDHRRVLSQDYKDHRRTVSTASSSFVPTVSEDGEFKLIENDEHHPDIISYRRSKRPKSSSVSSIGSVAKSPAPLTDTGSPLTPSSLSFDRHLYIDEFYKETQYRYATLKRNADFHALFDSIPVDDRLLDDFSCALSREILIQGRIYISENYIGFNSNILGWVTNLVIPLKEVVNIEKKLTAGLFNNGIAIETKDAKHYFATFITRDATFKFLNTVWEYAAKLPNETSSIFKNRQMNLKYKPDGIGLIDFSRTSDEEMKESLDDAFEFQNFQNIAMTIDGDTPRRTSDMENDVVILDTAMGSEYHNDGPETHAPTDIDYDLKKNGEVLLFSENFNATPGLIFNILFGEHIEFHRHMMELGQGSNFSEYSKFEDDDDGRLIRKFSYTKALGYSIGPKSTKVEVVETIEKKDYDSVINVLTTTVTPDVPSGNVFSVNTRYIFAWGPNNTTNFQLSYFMKWTGKSWIKGIIESQTATGQKAAAELLSKELRSKISEEAVMNSGLTLETVPVTPIIRQESTFKEKMIEEVTAVENAVQSIGHDISVTIPKWLAIVILIVLSLQIYTISIVQQNNALVQRQIRLSELVLKSQTNDKKTVKSKINDIIFSHSGAEEEALDKKIQQDLEYYNEEMGKS